jgi:acetyltransferase-like isoleucine patch superfamily enzyme
MGETPMLRKMAGAMDYRDRFKRCGKNVEIAPDVYIERPEVMEVGDNVKFMRGFYMIEGPGECTIGDNVTFYPNCFVQGKADRLIIENNVDFFPGQYLSLGGKGSFIDIGHHSHFAPNCILYGWGGLKIGPKCNIAAHTVFATIGHDPVVRGPRDQEKAMCDVAAVSGPITLVEDVWTGANVVITANVTVARGCIIGAGAVLTKSTQPYGVYVGVPAHRQRDRKRESTQG